MDSLKGSQLKYLPIHDDDGESESFLPLSEKDENDGNKHIAKTESGMRKYIPWALHLGLILMYTAIMLTWKPRVIIREPFDGEHISKVNVVNNTNFLLAPSDAPIEYETVRFFDSSKPESPYFGPSTPETDLAWDGLLPSIILFLFCLSLIDLV